MRTIVDLEPTLEGLVMTRHPAISSFFAMAEHVRTLRFIPMMRLPRISPEALKKAIEMGQSKEAL